MPELIDLIKKAGRDGHLLESTVSNLAEFLAQSPTPLYVASVAELVEGGRWSELNDRFYRTLAFGTGGLRGRTIGRVVTRAEQGTPTALGRPEHPCVGTNAMNFYNVRRATLGLATYVKEWWAAEGKAGKPGIVFAHDTRHFSREFAECAARLAAEVGCEAYLFAGPRSTPELSFAVRHLGAAAGVVLTASHNPPHDNGYKAYFADGAQVVEPHAGAIIARVNAQKGESYTPLSPDRQGGIHTLGEEIDRAYMDRLQTLVLDPDLVRSQNTLKFVFTPIHGTGGEITRPMLRRLGFQFLTVPEQDAHDGRFPTVKSPNPENAEALSMAIALAEKEGADLLLGTDPDCDRMGVAARGRDGKMQLLTGNQIGSLLAWYRVHTLFRQGVLTPANRGRATLIKTFVTTDLQSAIAAKAGIRMVETLTGFKYIGAKLCQYEAALPPEIRARYRAMDETETRRARLEHSTYYVCGGEESYGYSGGDFVRDKDGNGAVVMFAEVAAYAKSRGLTLDALLDEVYAAHGFYLEKNAALVFEGADGAARIARLADSYAKEPPAEVDGSPVVSRRDFAAEEIRDSEGDLVPKEKMLVVELADGRRFAVRPSGTEPKIKYYLFARRNPPAGASFTAADLAAIKPEVANSLDRLWAWLQADAEARLRP